MGRCNFIPVEAIENDRVAVLRNGKRIETANADPSARVLAIRPHNLVVTDGASANSFSGRLVRSLYLGPIVQLTIDAGGFQLEVDAPSEKAGGYAVGDDVTVRVDPKNARLIAEAAA
jgi:ABC-type Fe3+/spermidine/putrescine transport system ATPase subunit